MQLTALRVIRPGMLTTVQDLGRWGYQGHGVPVAGPMDWYSHRLANRLVGNAADAAALEVTLVGPELEADGETLCAIAGAEFSVTVDGGSVPIHTPFGVRKGGRLRFGARGAGARATLAVAGGFAVRPTFGSRATSISSGMGPFDGRPLAPGDILPIGDARTQTRVTLPAPALAMPRGGARVRAIAGPHDQMFTASALERFFSSRYIVSPQSNRMGYRLEGARLTHSTTADILSEATPLGTIQVPAAGQPILLMADRQTTGGYPKIATVITADIPLAGQLAPGDWIEFVRSSREAAVEALRTQEARLGARPS